MDPQIGDKVQIFTANLPTEQKLQPQVCLKKRTAVIAVIVGASSVLLLITAVCGIYIHEYQLQSSNKDYKIDAEDENGNMIEVKVKIDTSEQTEEYDIKQQKFLLIHDFKNGITILRTTIDETYACYFKPLKKTGKMDPKTLKSYFEQNNKDFNSSFHTEKNEEDDKTVYAPSDYEIGDCSSCSVKVREACRRLSIFWLLPQPKADYTLQVNETDAITEEEALNITSQLETRRFKRSILNYGRWCGQTHTGIDTTSGCSCPSLTATCRTRRPPIDSLDAACLNHDFCVHCQLTGTPVHYCYCERRVMADLDSSDCKGKNSCSLYRAGMRLLFSNLPCVCKQVINIKFPCGLRWEGFSLHINYCYTQGTVPYFVLNYQNCANQ